MSDVYFEKALISLKKTSDVNRLQKILSVIRKEVVWPEKKANILKLEKQGCLKYLIACLLKHHVPLLNTTLSILGNCCMERITTRDVGVQHDLFGNLSRVLKRYSHDSIRGRTFRILGNIFKHHDYYANILLTKDKQLQIISITMKFLKWVASSPECCILSSTNEIGNSSENCSSDATTCMAIRCMRELVSAHTIFTLIEDFDVIKITGMIAVKFTPIWKSTGKHDEVLNSVLKLLFAYANHKSVNLIPELQNCGTGNAMDQFGNLLFLSPYIVVKIVMNLLKTSTLRSDLPISNMSEILVQKLNNVADFTNGREDLRFREYIKCLSFLLHHPANKEDLRRVGIIPAFISILRDYVDQTGIALKNSILILSTLRICMYDEVSLLGMLECDMINVLISKLNWVVGTDDDFDLSHVYKPDGSSRKQQKFLTNKCFMHKLTSDGLGFPCCSTRSDTPYNYFQFNRHRTLSPSSEHSLLSLPHSPQNPGLSDNDDSDDYSPVCSDSEDNNKSLIDDGGDAEMVCEEAPSPYYDDVEMVTSTGCWDDIPVMDINKMSHILSNEIIRVIKLFIKLRPVVMDLVTTDLLLKLLKFLFPKHANACPADTLTVILSIVETPDYLLRLMLTDFVTATYKLSVLSHGSDCTTCTKLFYISQIILFKITGVVESGSGKGDIAHQLYRATLPVKQRLVSSIPFVTGNKLILVKLMIECGGLNVLVQSFQEQSSIQLKCICSLVVLAIKLGIKNPATNEQEPICIPIDFDNYAVNEKYSTTVCFKMDDGTTIQADREFLSEKSEYFRCLLSGEFKESGETEIALHNVPWKAFKLLLTLLQFNVNNTDIYKIDADLDLLLEVIALSESYLLSDLCSCIALSIQCFKFLPSSIPVVYSWSLESGTDILRVECVAYALVGEMNDSERFDMFSGLVRLGCIEKLGDDIKALITRFLGPTKCP